MDVVVRSLPWCLNFSPQHCRGGSGPVNLAPPHSLNQLLISSAAPASASALTLLSSLHDGWAPFSQPGTSFPADTLGPFSLRLYQIKKRAEVCSLAAFQDQGRLVELPEHPYISFLPPHLVSLVRTPGGSTVRDGGEGSPGLVRVRGRPASQ